MENCSASWRRQNPFLLAIFCNENSRNECAITCGNKFQILSHKSSVLQITNCKPTPAYLNFKMLISLCVWIATKERKNIFRHKKSRQCQIQTKERHVESGVWLVGSLRSVCEDSKTVFFITPFPATGRLSLRLECCAQASLEMYAGVWLFLVGYSNFHLLWDAEMDGSGIQIMGLLKVSLKRPHLLTS